MHIEFKRPPLPLLPGAANDSTPPENLNVNMQIHMSGIITVMVIAPDDDQKVFPLVPESERANLMSKTWVRASMTILIPALNQIVEQTLLEMHLYPVSNVIQPGCAIDRNGKLVYTFQVPVQTFPAGAAPVQQGGPAASDGATVQ
jgi:hypothetical protein